MAKIKIWGSFENEPFHVITYDSNDIESIAIAEQEKADTIEKLFKNRTLKEVYVMSYDDNGDTHTTLNVKNKNYADSYVFIVDITTPIIYGVYKSIESAKSNIKKYFSKTHNEFESDEIIEIVNELLESGRYQLNKTNYYFSVHCSI